jgi:hypothetical protein
VRRGTIHRGVTLATSDRIAASGFRFLRTCGLDLTGHKFSVQVGVSSFYKLLISSQVCRFCLPGSAATTSLLFTATVTLKWSRAEAEWCLFAWRTHRSNSRQHSNLVCYHRVRAPICHCAAVL